MITLTWMSKTLKNIFGGNIGKWAGPPVDIYLGEDTKPLVQEIYPFRSSIYKPLINTCVDLSQ